MEAFSFSESKPHGVSRDISIGHHQGNAVIYLMILFDDAVNLC
jgi:hypothetical protein